MELRGAATLARLCSVLAIKSMWLKKVNGNPKKKKKSTQISNTKGRKCAKKESGVGEAEQWNQKYMLTKIHTELHTITYTICPSHFLSHTLAVLLQQTAKRHRDSPQFNLPGNTTRTCVVCVYARLCTRALHLCLIAECNTCSFHCISSTARSVECKCNCRIPTDIV